MTRDLESGTGARAWNLHIKADDKAFEAANLVRLDLGIPSVSGT
jgi:hypothetical protein